MKATKVYRDNFIYNINTPLCEMHAEQCKPSRGGYAYIEAYDGGAECDHCLADVRRKALEANRIEWTLTDMGHLIYTCKDRLTFWDFVKRYRRKSNTYQINEKLF